MLHLFIVYFCIYSSATKVVDSVIIVDVWGADGGVLSLCMAVVT